MTERAHALDDKLHRQITALCDQGNALQEQGELEEAFDAFNAAYALIPSPKENWNATLWVAAALGDVAFEAGWYPLARDILQDAMYCPGAIGNPFLHLRLGQTLLELRELDRAADELIRAYALEGPELFKPEKPKYLVFLSTRCVNIEFPKSYPAAVVQAAKANAYRPPK